MSLNWDGAACADRDGKVAVGVIGTITFNDLFFGPDDEPDRRHRWREGVAVAVCARCPLRLPCLEYALAEGHENGVWGGVTEAGRMHILRRRRKKAYRERQVAA